MFLKIVTKWREIKKSKLSISLWPIERSQKIFHMLFYRLGLIKNCLFSSSWLRRQLVIVLRSTIGIVHYVHHALNVGPVTDWKLSVWTNKTRSVWNVILGTIIQTPQTWNHVNCKLKLAVQSNLFNTDTKGTEPVGPLYRCVRIIEVGKVWFLAILGPNKLSVIERCPYYRVSVREGPLEKLLGGGGGNVWAAGIFFRYQIPCLNIF